MHSEVTPIHHYKKYWAECFGTAPFLPTSREEMDQLGWDSCDVIIVTAMLMLITQALVWQSSAAYLKHKVSELGSLRSQNGKLKTPL